MLQAMHINVAGIRSFQQSLDQAAGNLANLNTTAYKRVDVHFSDLFYADLRERRFPVAPGAVATGVGRGAAAVPVTVSMSQGSLEQSFRALDLAVEGDGFFRILNAGGEATYTRDGGFYLDGDGRLVTAGGDYLDIDFNLNGFAIESVRVTPEGKVTVSGEGGLLLELGEIKLYRFKNSAGLLRERGGRYLPTASSGAPQEGTPGEDGFGRIRQYHLEQSNADMTLEMVLLIQSQRALQSSIRSLITADELNAMILQVTA